MGNITTLILDKFERETLGLLLDSLDFLKSDKQTTYAITLHDAIATSAERERLLDLKDFLLDTSDDPTSSVARKVKKWRGSPKFQMPGTVRRLHGSPTGNE